MPPKAVVVTGPTATGKTRLGVSLAELLSGEVISADSMQVYKLMDIGTAKPTADEMRGIPHHMIDVVSPFERYSAARYVEDAARCADDVIARGKIPVIVGGTGLYIDSLISGRDFAPESADRAATSHRRAPTAPRVRDIPRRMTSSAGKRCSGYCLKKIPTER